MFLKTGTGTEIGIEKPLRFQPLVTIHGFRKCMYYLYENFCVKKMQLIIEICLKFQITPLNCHK